MDGAQRTGQAEPQPPQPARPAVLPTRRQRRASAQAPNSTRQPALSTRLEGPLPLSARGAHRASGLDLATGDRTTAELAS